MEIETKEKINANVKSPHRDHHLRTGKGFSLAEIKEAGKTIKELKEMNLQIDYFRKTTHKENIEKLRDLKPTEKKTKKRKPYVYKEKKHAPFKPKKEKVVKKAIKKEVSVKKPAPKKKIPAPKEEPTKVKKQKIELKGTPLTSLSGLGSTTEKKFVELGVNTIEDLIKEDPKELAALIKGASEDRIKKWIEEGKELIQ